MTIKHVQSSTTTVSEIERTTMKRVALRIVPFLMLCFLINFIDRINVGMAALTMNHDIGLMPTELAFGVSLFFVAYVTFGVPSNLALERVGARRWLALIMVGWGVVSMATAFIVGTKSFYVNRFLLGLTEAGFLPGSILFMSYWFPSSYRAKMISIFAMAMPISGFVGSPISGLLLGMHGILGLKGWQWLFLLEAFPAVTVPWGSNIAGSLASFSTVVPDRTVSSVTSSPRTIWACAAAIAEPGAMGRPFAARNTSPVDSGHAPSALNSNPARVPLPAPGGPRSTRRQARLTSRGG